MHQRQDRRFAASIADGLHPLNIEVDDGVDGGGVESARLSDWMVMA